MRRAFFGSGVFLLVGCGTEIDRVPVVPPGPLACAIVADEVIEGMNGFEGHIAVAGDGSVFVVWPDEGFRAARRAADGAWERIDGAAAGAPYQQLSLVGTPDGVAALLISSHEPTRLWRHRDGDWQLALETASDTGGNQSHDNLAAAPDGSLHFALRVERQDDMPLELLALAPSEDAPVSLGAMGDGRDPMIAVDDDGARHVVYQVADDTRRLRYLSPNGARHTLAKEREAWPSLVAAPDGLFFFSAASTSHVDGEPIVTPPELLTTRDGESWDRFDALEPIMEPCEELGTWNHDAIGTTCRHHVYRDDGHELLGGPRALLLLRERTEQGQKVWDCSDQGEHMCSWKHGDDYGETVRLLIGRVNRGGTQLAPLPIEVVERMSIDAAQDATGGVHLLLGEPIDDDERYRYVQLACEEEAK